jgi:hypothetical protein
LPRFTVCTNTSFGRPPCVATAAQITDRYISFRGNCTNCLANVIDRQTGLISYAAGGSGSCGVSSQRKF